jgi:hypothetical protein
MVLILVLALAAGAAQAVPLGSWPVGREPAVGLFQRVWTWIAAQAAPERPGREKEGGVMDPDGLHGAAGPGGEAGGILDPNG